MATLSTFESTTLDKTIRFASKWFILTQKTQNLEMVNLKSVTYAQPIPLSLITQRQFSLATLSFVFYYVAASIENFFTFDAKADTVVND